MKTKRKKYSGAFKAKVGVEAILGDGGGRCLDNRFIEPLWRSAKYEDIYVNDYLDALEAGWGLSKWFSGNNETRPHQALGYATPGQLYHDPGAYGAKAGGLGLASLVRPKQITRAPHLLETKTQTINADLTTATVSEIRALSYRTNRRGTSMTLGSLVFFGSKWERPVRSAGAEERNGQAEQNWETRA